MTAQSQEELLAAHLEEQKIDVTSLPFDTCFIFAMFMEVFEFVNFVFAIYCVL